MQVKLQNIGKTYQNHTVFKNIDYVFNPGYRGVVLGGNGSGKSTLLKVISTATVPTTGEVTFTEQGKTLADEDRYKYVAYCAPYIDLIEDFTLKELVQFQSTFKPFLNGLTTQKIIDLLYLDKFAAKPIKSYSSGMKQRVKLALAICADTPILLLDEPTSNLDKKGKDWYQQLIADYGSKRIIIVASNSLSEEYGFTENEINIENYK